MALVREITINKPISNIMDSSIALDIGEVFPTQYVF